MVHSTRNGKKSFNKLISWLMVCVMFISLFCLMPDKETDMNQVEASDAEDISLTVTSAPTEADSDNKVEVTIAKSSAYSSMKSLADAGYTTLEISLTVTSYTSAVDTPGIMPFVVYGSDYTWANGGVWVNLSGNTTYTLDLDLSGISTTDTGDIDHFGFQVSGVSGSMGYTINYAKLLASGSSSSGSSGSSSSADDNTSEINTDVTYNYAALLQESLYLYDANMCGTDVDENSAFSWRSDCHTGDQYVTYDGQTIDVSGGYHDAGDHVKFGLPQAYAASVLGMSYYQYKDAYDSVGATGHYTRIIERFVDYFERCTVLDEDGDVEAFCIQVGDGDTDHDYWGAPEDQDSTQGTRATQAYFTSSSDPATDIVSETAAALAIYYCNYKDTDAEKAETALAYAEKLFAYVNSFSTKSCSTVAAGYYDSNSWEDDYALAAAWLYKATGDSTYKTYYNNVYGSVSGVYWVMCWNNVSSAAVLYGPDSSKLSYVADYVSTTATSPVFDNNYAYVDAWGTARYNTALQFLGLTYDDITGSDNFGSWAKGQMQYLLGNNNGYHCFVVGYNSYSVQYPHHRAASGYSDVSSNSTTTLAHVLIGAMVGGPDSDSSNYTDDANNYSTNEVALDYQASCVAAAAALYEYVMANGTDDEKADQVPISDESTLTSEMRTAVVEANKTASQTTEEATTESTTTEEATTEETTTESATTEEATTVESATTEVPTTEAATTEAPTTEESTTETPTTETPTTETPTTETPTTETPTTEAPTTEVPTTETPTTETPTTEESTTEAPTTETSTTETPTTETTTTETKVTLSTPLITSLTNTTSGITIKWSKVSNADGYYVYRRASGGSWTRIKTVSGASTVTCADTSAAAGTVYAYTVKAYKSTSSGMVYSSYNKTGTGTIRLKTPTLGTFSNTTAGMKITWSKVAGAKGYYVYRRVSGGSWVRVGNVTSGSQTYFVDKTAAAGKVYAYTVKAYYGTIYSAYNTTGKGTIRLKTPTLGTFSNTSSGVKVTWSKVTGAKGYYVYRRVSGGSWARVGNVTSGSQTYFIDKTAASGTVYAYTVKAYYGSYYSAYNTTGKGTYYLKQPTPKAVASSGKVTVSWTKTTGAAGYYVYRRTASGSWARIATIKSGSTIKYVDKTAKAGTKYYYTVRAYKGSYSSSYHTTGYAVTAKK